MDQKLRRITWRSKTGLTAVGAPSNGRITETRGRNSFHRHHRALWGRMAGILSACVCPAHFKKSSLFHAAHNARRGLLLRLCRRLTQTAHPNYHLPSDSIDTLDFAFMELSKLRVTSIHRTGKAGPNKRNEDKASARSLRAKKRYHGHDEALPSVRKIHGGGGGAGYKPGVSPEATRGGLQELY